MQADSQGLVNRYPLELDGTSFTALVHKALAHLSDFLDSLSEQPASCLDNSAVSARAVTESIPTEAVPFDLLLHQLFHEAFPKAFNTTGPGYLAYVPGGGLPHAAVADLISLITNRYVGLWSAAPVVAQIEATVVRWLCEIVGYGPESGGFLTSGGSLANWAALVTARERIGLDRTNAAVVYTSLQAHHSVQKAAALVGISRDRVRLISVDQEYRISLDALESHIDADQTSGLVPMAIVAHGGTTNTGAVDDLEGVTKVATERNIWLHVDAAYGGFFLLTERGRSVMEGISRADSIALDPHKGLFLPYGTGGLVVRDRSNLAQTFAGRGEYMTAVASDEFVDFCDISPELTREFRGLRIWLPIKMHGIATFQECLDEKLDLAAYAAQELRRIPGMEIIEPQLSIVAFRLEAHEASQDTGNRLNRNLLELINAGRRVLLSGTMLDNRFFLRLCILSFRTHRDRIDECLDIIRRSVGQLQADDRGV